MIRVFKARRMLFAPIGFLNSVARWILGVHSSDGSLTVRNTANPDENGSLDLRVNVDAVFAQVERRLDTRVRTEAEIGRVKDIVRGALDGVSVTVRGEHVCVDADWLDGQIMRRIEEAGGGQPSMPASPSELTGGYGSGTTALLSDEAADLTAEGGGGCTFYVLSRAKADGAEKVKLFFRKVTVAGDGRIAKVGGEISAVNVYPG